MVVRCPHCGSLTDRPQLFSITRQRIFNHIWDNPGCSYDNIAEAVYGRRLVDSNTLAVHISNIRKDLLATEYRVKVVDRCYSIKMLPPTVGVIRKALTEVPPNASL